MEKKSLTIFFYHLQVLLCLCPGFGPGPRNRMVKSVSVPGIQKYKDLNPSIMGESASNNPLLNSEHQGTGPVKSLQRHFGEKNNSVSKNLVDVSNQSKTMTSSQTFKPISTSLATLLVTSLKTGKRKRAYDKNDNRLSDMIASLPSGSKLPKVKTTQELIADWKAKMCGKVSPDTFSSTDSLHSSEAEVSRTKSELQNIVTAQSERQESNQSPTDESNVSIMSDYQSHFISDEPSVINRDSDITTFNSYPDSVDEEVNRILSTLPPIDPAEISLEEDDLSLPNRPSSVTSDDLNRLSEPWEYVNGMYDCNGTWRPWEECCEQKSLGESFLILPYVNID